MTTTPAQFVNDIGLQSRIDHNDQWFLVAFLALDSIPCSHYVPEFMSYASKVGHVIPCLVIDQEENPEISASLDVYSVPVTILFHKAQPVLRLDGPIERTDLYSRVAKAVDSCI